MAVIAQEEALIQWFLEVKRDFPWREAPTPYRVWISEVMLQQTQAAVVVPYFQRWMEAFPNIEVLAASKIEEVMKLWEGLGYYSRARNIHAAAKTIVSEYGGDVPRGKADLSKLKGLGPYTVGAIRSFAFHEKDAAVDGNVIRVLARYFALEDDISKPKTIQNIWRIAAEILPPNSSWLHNEALIELGATVCSKKPACLECPLRKGCRSYGEGKVGRIPYKSKKCATTFLQRLVIIFKFQNKLLAGQVDHGRVMAGLYEFPYFEYEGDIQPLKEARNIAGERGMKAEALVQLSEATHTFTRYRAKLIPVVVELSERAVLKGFRWFSLNELTELPFSSGHKRILIDYQESISESSTHRSIGGVGRPRNTHFS